MTILEPRRRFDAEDGFLFAILGLLRRTGELESWLARPAAGVDRPAPPEDPLLDALLGAIALGSRVQSEVEGWAGPALPEEPRSEEFSPMEELLR